MSFTDVSADFAARQLGSFEVFGSSGQTDRGLLLSPLARTDNHKVVVDGIESPSWRVLDKATADGISLSGRAIDSVPGKLANELGTVVAIERDHGTTKLFLIWISRVAGAALTAGRFSAVNLHLLFHPPTYEPEYVNAPYWRGSYKDGDVTYHPFVKLAARYLCRDFRSVAQQLLAVGLLEPSVIFVVPVADLPGNFEDLLTPTAMLQVCQEIAIFAAQQLGGSRINSGDVPIGKVMLSVYSHSGDRLHPLLSSLTNSTPLPNAASIQAGTANCPGLADRRHRFFRDHLWQVNMFDPNVSDKSPQKRTQLFWQLCCDLAAWRQVNPAAHAYLYTVYPNHVAMFCKAMRFQANQTVSLQTVPWSDEPLRSAKDGQPRGTGREGYNDDATLGALHLPISFFNLWLPQESPPPNPAGFANQAHGSFHGHGWFLRSMIAHAFSHADRAWFGSAQRH